MMITWHSRRTDLICAPQLMNFKARLATQADLAY
jgi:hypothetical protein